MKRRRFLFAMTAIPFAAQAVRAASHAAPVDVAISGFAFAPATVEVTAGHAVRWTNMDGARHSATADDGSFDTGLMKKNASGDVVFDEPGTYTYFCKAHRGMKGTVVVK
ncbi:MAG: cupredoxin domain-containing protein [Brevirhabdus sp.]